MKPKFTVNIKLALACCLVMIVAPLWSHAQSANQSLAKRLEIMEKQLRAVQRRVFKGAKRFQDTTEPTPSVPGGNTRLADIESRLSQMETQLRQLTGRIEEGNYQFGRLKQQLATMTRDYEFRLAELEKSGPKISSKVDLATTTAPTVQETKKNILPAGTEKQQYSYAQKLVTKGQYARAEKALGAFLKRYPKAKLAGNAQYWLGQTYYVRKMYTKATRAFLEGYNNYPESPKAPAFLLKIGMSLYAMGEKNDACDAYRELASRFPDSSESKNKRPPEGKRAGCK